MSNPNTEKAPSPRDRRVHTSRKRLLLRLWEYLGRNRLLLVLALALSLSSSTLSL